MPSLPQSARAATASSHLRLPCTIAFLVSCAVALLGLPSADAQTPPPPRDTIADPTAPLGSPTNPVLAYGPSGQREFLARLRCGDNTVPEVLSRGSLRGVHGHIMDNYSLRCGTTGAIQSLFMDMYHGPERETRAVPGFSVLPEHPARLATGCPPKVVADADSSARYVFLRYEVEKSAKLEAPVPQSVPGSAADVLSVSYVIDTTGTVDRNTLKFNKLTDSVAVAAARQVVHAIRWTPAEHHAGCKVRQFGGGNFTVKVGGELHP